ncbi:MAG: mucoidy inhibitor MuiA family protein [Candidatus Didemnitutus sp.]|nr:mucoidy inhibitor MuiA family protein [Candidatus Didemnitutus sp.]
MKFLRLSGLFLALAAALSAAPVESRISAVTVYTDRAVVTRTATANLTPGQTELVFERLPEALWEQSLQVGGQGTAAATILDVSARRTFVDFTPNERAAELEQQLRAAQAEQRQLADERAVLDTQRQATVQYLNGAVSPGGKDIDRPKLDDVRAALAFGRQQLAEFAAATQQLDARAEDVQRKIAALEAQLNELRGGRGRAYKSVVVRVAAAQAGSLDVTLAYTVGGAQWQPSYDARVASSERAVALGYFGVVRQNTGEDWPEVALILSTARPALGGAAPELGVWEVVVRQPVVLQERAQRYKVEMPQVTLSAAPAASYGRVIGSVEVGEPESRSADLAVAAIEAGATSASFKIATPTTIPSDGSARKVPITTARLEAAPEYATTPKLQTTAFLTTKVTNNTDFPLLAGAMNVFLDGTFVATSQLKTVMPAEKFDLALGADEGIAVKHRRVQRFTENTGLTNSGRRLTYEYLLTIQNNKPAAARIVVSDQIPLSRHEKIVVRQVAPTERELKPDNEGKLKWTLDLKPGEKRELTVKFTVEHPADLDVTGLE